MTRPSSPANPLRLSQAIQRRLRLDAVCHSCHHRAPLDATELMLRVGEDFPVPRLNGRLRCTACNGKQAEVLVLAKARPERAGAAESFR
jgi:ribosomal protein L40E